MEICGMYIQGLKLLFHHTPKMLYWVEIWGHFSTVNSLSCSINQFEMIPAL